MEEKFEILHKYTDEQIWLLQLMKHNESFFYEVSEEACLETAKHFNINPNYVKELVETSTKFKYTKKEIPIVEYYFEHTRKIQIDHQ